MVDDADPQLSVEALADELRAGFAETLRLLRLGVDQAFLAEVQSAFDRLH